MHGEGDDSEQAIIRDYKDSLVQCLAPAAITTWIEKIVDTANALCGSGSVAIKYKKGEGYLGEIVVPTKKDAECLSKAINMHALAAPELVRDILMAYKAKLLLT